MREPCHGEKRTKEIQLKHLPFNLTPMKKLLHPLTRLLLAVGLSAFSVVAFAQKTAVNGIVTDAEGAPLVGATVIVMQNARPEDRKSTRLNSSH